MDALEGRPLSLVESRLPYPTAFGGVRGSPMGHADATHPKTHEAGAAPAAALSAADHAVLEAAHELGYYTIPRRGSLADVARRLGCSPSAASYRLRRAERNLWAWYRQHMRTGPLHDAPR